MSSATVLPRAPAAYLSLPALLLMAVAAGLRAGSN